MSPSPARGRIVWYELLTTDPKKAIDFYTKLFGWSIVHKSNPAGGIGEYHHLGNNGQPFGGLMQLPEQARKMGAPSHWHFYMGVDNVDEALKQAQKLGARAYMPATDIPNTGRFTMMADPQGAVFSMIQPAPGQPEPPPEQKPQVGQVSWHELATTDAEAGFRFYQTMFGWEKREAHDMGPLGMYQEIGRPGVQHMMGAVFNKPPEMPVAAWCLYVRVASCEDAAKKIGELGGTVINGPMEVPGGDRVAQAMDPTGALFAVHQSH